MKNTVKTLLIIAVLFQGTMAFAEKVTINSGGADTYNIEPGKAAPSCKGTLEKGKRGSISCEINMKENMGGVPVFVIRKGGQACSVTVGNVNPLKLNGGPSAMSCGGINFSGNVVGLQ